MFRFIVTTLVLVLAAEPVHSASISEREAARVIEDDWNAGLERYPLGTFLAQGDINDLSQGRISVAMYHTLKGVEYAGIVQVAELPQPTMAFGLPVTPPHIFSKRVSVTLTQKGMKLNGWKRPENWKFNYSLFGIRQGTFKINRIVRNEEMKRGSEIYRLVLVAYTANWSEAYLSFLADAQKGLNLSEGRCAHCGSHNRLGVARKARVLLKRDDFKNAWTVVTSDVANEDEEFKTRSVDDILARS